MKREFTLISVVWLLGAVPGYCFYNPGCRNGGASTAAATESTLQYRHVRLGQALRGTGPTTNANLFRVATRHMDTERDLIYYGYRYYNASAGRWISRDPLSERGGLNIMAFLGNDLVDRYDPLGLLPPVDIPGQPGWPKDPLPNRDYFRFYNPACDTACLCVVRYKAHGKTHTELEQAYFDADVDNLRNKLAIACSTSKKESFRTLCQQMAELYASYY